MPSVKRGTDPSHAPEDRREMLRVVKADSLRDFHNRQMAIVEHALALCYAKGEQIFMGARIHASTELMQKMRRAQLRDSGYVFQSQRLIDVGAHEFQYTAQAPGRQGAIAGDTGLDSVLGCQEKPCQRHLEAVDKEGACKVTACALRLQREEEIRDASVCDLQVGPQLHLIARKKRAACCVQSLIADLDTQKTRWVSPAKGFMMISSADYKLAAAEFDLGGLPTIRFELHSCRLEVKNQNLVHMHVSLPLRRLQIKTLDE